jgi:hypothetical protein
VTCCFTVIHLFQELWVNERNYTDRVVLVGGGANSNSYTVSFGEPSQTATLAIKNYEELTVYQAGIRMMCVCSRSNSPWNMNTTLNTGWRSVSSNRTTGLFDQDNFNPGWNMNTYLGPSPPAVGVASNNLPLLNITSEICGPQSIQANLGHPQGSLTPRSYYWGLRRQVDQVANCFPTSAPTTSPSAGPVPLAPTSSPIIPPSASPAHVVPTASPTAGPETRLPSSSPTMTPSASPTTRFPSRSPVIVTVAPSSPELTSGQIVGIVVGCLGGLVVLGGAVALGMRMSRPEVMRRNPMAGLVFEEHHTI